MIFQEAISSLDELRKFIGSKSEITLTNSKWKGCERGKEGSGNLENDDEDFGCAVEGSGQEGSGDMTFVDTEDDFVFDREEEPLSPTRRSPLQAFGTNLKAFTNQVVSKSEDIAKKALSVKEPMKGEILQTFSRTFQESLLEILETISLSFLLMSDCLY